MTKLIIVVLALLVVASAEQVIRTSEQSRFGKLKFDGSSFCIPLPELPKDYQFDAKIQFVFDQPTNFHLQFKDARMSLVDIKSELHTIKIHTNGHGINPVWNPTTMMKDGMIAGALTSTAKLLGIKFEFATEESNIIPVHGSDQKCAAWLSSVDALVGDHPGSKPVFLISPFALLGLIGLFVCSVVLPCVYLCVMASTPREEADDDLERLSNEADKADNSNSNAIPMTQIPVAAAPPEYVYTQPYTAPMMPNSPFNVMYATPQLYPDYSQQQQQPWY